MIHPDDREQVERSVMDAVDAGPAVHARVPDRAAATAACAGCSSAGRRRRRGDGRHWLDGAIFDITARRAAEQALREREIVEAQLAEVRASRARILEAADRARREIERNLHDGAQQRFVSLALRLQVWLAAHRDLRTTARGEIARVSPSCAPGLPSCATSRTACIPRS